MANGPVSAVRDTRTGYVNSLALLEQPYSAHNCQTGVFKYLGDYLLFSLMGEL